MHQFNLKQKMICQHVFAMFTFIKIIITKMFPLSSFHKPGLKKASCQIHNSVANLPQTLPRSGHVTCTWNLNLSLRKISLSAVWSNLAKFKPFGKMLKAYGNLLGLI